MNWVKLTSVRENKVALWVNLDRLVGMYLNEDGTVVRFDASLSNSAEWTVRETPEEILELAVGQVSN